MDQPVVWLGERIRDLRRETYPNQRALGAALEQPVNQSAVCLWEQGKGLTMRNLQALAAAFGLSLEALIDPRRSVAGLLRERE